MVGMMKIHFSNYESIFEKYSNWEKFNNFKYPLNKNQIKHDAQKFYILGKKN